MKKLLPDRMQVQSVMHNVTRRNPPRYLAAERYGMDGKNALDIRLPEVRQFRGLHGRNFVIASDCSQKH